MENLAKSISRNLRTMAYQPPPVIGTAFSTTTVAEVRWEWLALPFGLLLASLILLIAVAIQTKRRNVVPWTNNILAALFHGMDKRSGTHQGLETQDAMQTEARSLLVEFQPLQGGGQLVVAGL